MAIKNIFQIIRDSQSSNAKTDNVFGVTKVIKYFDGEKELGIPEDSIEATTFINYSFSEIKKNKVRGKLFLPFSTHITRGCAPGDLVLVIFDNLRNSDGYWIRPLQSIELKNLQGDKNVNENQRGIGFITLEDVEKFLIDRSKLSTFSFYKENNLFNSYALPVDGNVTLEFGVIGTNEAHNGIDITPSKNNLVLSPSTCIVEKIGKDIDYGKYILLRDCLKKLLVFKFAHLDDKNIVSKEQKVYKGETIGFVGKTGKANYRHLHFEVFYNDKIINPRPMFSGYKPVIYNRYIYLDV